MGTKIINLPATTSILGNGYIPISQDITGSNRTTYKITAQQLASYIGTTTSSGTVNSVGLSSSDNSVAITGSPITTRGLIGVSINSVNLDKINDGGARDGQVLTYDGILHKWKPIDSSNTGVTADSVQIGTVLWFAASSAPIGYLECNGQSVTRSGYSELFNVIGTLYGSVNGSEFTLPDLRGEFIRGWSHGKIGVDTDRTFGSNQIESLKSHSHDLDRVLTWPARTGHPAIAEQHQDGNPNDYSGYMQTTSAFGGSETRPRNIALLPCIKALKTITGTTSLLDFIPKPSNPTNGQQLVYDSSTLTWKASTVKANTTTTTDGSYIILGDAILQTGNLYFNTNSIQTKTFIYPRPFTTKVLSVNATPTGTAAMYVSNITLTSCKFTNSWVGWEPNALSALITVIGI